jgi:hypothetical protein
VYPTHWAVANEAQIPATTLIDIKDITVPRVLLAAEYLPEKVLSNSFLLRLAKIHGAVAKRRKMQGAIKVKYPPPTGVKEGYQRGVRVRMEVTYGKVPIMFIGWNQ